MVTELESVNSRFNRDYLQRRDDRKSRDYDKMSVERKDREYVDPETDVPAWSLVPANTASPSITGTTTVGQTLTGANGTWTNSPTFAKQWLRDGVAISGATGNTYVLQAGDATHKISLRVTASKTDYPDQIATSGQTATIAAS